MGRPGRPKVDPYGTLTLNLNLDVVNLIHEYGDRHNIPYKKIVEEAVLLLFKGGNERLIALTAEAEKYKNENKDLKEENEKLSKEKNYLEKKIERLEKENEELKARWKGQTTLKKYEKKTQEIKAIVERISQYIEEGKTWREVAKEAGFVIPSDQIDILKLVFVKKGYSFRSEFLPGWKLSEPRHNAGYLEYVFKRDEDGHAAITRRVAEVST